MSQKPLHGKTALITGSSRGIGRAIALELADRGAQILVNYVRNEEAAREAVQLLQAKGVRVESFQANLKEPDEITKLSDFCLERFGVPDILIHNAAMGAFKPLHKLKLNQWSLSMDINAQAFLLLVQKFLPGMEARQSGCIIALSSLGSRKFIPNYGAIGISKSAVESLVRYLAAELAPKGIRVNAVSGGPVETAALKAFPQYEASLREVVARTPAGRVGTPEDLARVVTFLTLPESAWIYGQTLIADGGLSLI